MKRTVISAFTVILVVYAGACGWLYVAQRSMIYYPVAAGPNPHGEDLRWESGAETLQIWRLNGSSRDAIIYFGGNAEDVAQNSQQFSRLFANQAVYLVNYRGYGASSGTPTEAALKADAAAIYDRVAESHERVMVVGRSLGSGVAMHLGAHRKPARLALITPFASISGVAQAAFPLFPVNLLLTDRFDSEAYAGDVAAPVLMLVAGQDEVIPRWSSDRLAAALDRHRLTMQVVPSADHNTIQGFEQFETALGTFVD